MARIKGSKAVSKRAPAPRMGVASKRLAKAPEAELNVLKSELKARVAHLNTLLPGKTAPSATMISAIFAYSGEIIELAREVSSRAGIETKAKEGTPAPDFSFKTYEQFLAELNEADTHSAKPMPTAAGQEFLVLVVKTILAAAGISNQSLSAVMTALEELAKKDTQDLIRHIRNRHWAQARGSLVKVLNVLRSAAFRTRLAARIGARAAAQLVARIASKFIPFIGPAAFVASLIWEIARLVF